MKYAIVEGRRTEPSRKTRGVCENCGGEAIAKCGEHVLWHWAHKTRQHCDHWWENEGVWHRAWKNQFPAEWQEVVLEDPVKRERHIADVRTPAGLVVELQRSTIEPAEVKAREAYYQKMVWLIDGCKNDFDRVNFSMWRSSLTNGWVSFRWFGRSKLFARWHTTKPVFMDFGEEHGFWRIAHYDPKTKLGQAVLVRPSDFVQLVISGTTDFSQGGGPASDISRI